MDRPLGEWRLRAASGFTSRANSALAIGDPGMPVAAALRVLRDFTAEHGIDPRALVPSDSPWETAIAEQGWVRGTGDAGIPEVVVRVAATAMLSRIDDDRAVIFDTPPSGWWELVVGAPPDPAQRHVLEAAKRIGFGLSRVDGEPVGAVRAVVVADHLHVARLEVADRHRRHGMGRALMAAAGRWGAERGAAWCVLQVSVNNGAATTFYDRLGFGIHHHYRYRVPVGAGPS